MRERAGDERWLKKMERGDKETHIKGKVRKGSTRWYNRGEKIFIPNPLIHPCTLSFSLNTFPYIFYFYHKKNYTVSTLALGLFDVCYSILGGM